MSVSVKEIIELLDEKVNSPYWSQWDSGYEFSAIFDFGHCKGKLENSKTLHHYLEKHNIDMVFTTTGTHFIKL